MTSAQVAATGLYDIINIEYSKGISPRQIETEPTAIAHLLWMLQQIIGGHLSSETKENRWLGYVQGILVSRELISVHAERDRTREIFNGE